MSEKHEGYAPALHFQWLTALYDPLVRVAMPEMAFKRRMMERAPVRDGYRVLDLGCGTGTHLAMIKQAHPKAEVTGLDYDPTILSRAWRKIRRAGLQVAIVRGTGFALPFEDGAFDRVFSSLVVHHLSAANKRLAFREVRRVLKPGGEAYIADFGVPGNAFMGVVAHFVGAFEDTSANLKGLLPEMMREAGLESVTQTDAFSTVFGTLAVYRGVKPVR